MWIKGMIIHPEILLICEDEEQRAFKKFLDSNKLKLFGFSTHENEEYKNAIEDMGGTLLTRKDIGKNKGSYKWVEYIERNFGIPHNKLIYLGYGNRKYDWATATNSSVFYLHYYKHDRLPEEIKMYALKVKKINSAIKFIKQFFEDPPLFTYKEVLSSQAALRILFDAGVTLSDYAGENFTLKDLFTYDKAHFLGKTLKLDARAALFLILTIQLWKEGIASRGTIWCVYPSSKKGKVSRNIEPYLETLKGLTGSYYKTVLERVTDTTDKSLARAKRERWKISFEKEKTTLQLSYKNLKNKKVIVVDDFTTSGMSLEVARQLITEGGATQITLCAVGKYDVKHTVYNTDGSISEEIELTKDLSAQEKLIELINKFNNTF